MIIVRWTQSCNQHAHNNIRSFRKQPTNSDTVTDDLDTLLAEIDGVKPSKPSPVGTVYCNWMAGSRSGCMLDRRKYLA